MKTKLDEIIANKRNEVSARKKKRDFMTAIKGPKVGDISIIAEIKLASPSRGKLGNVIDIEKKVKDYEKGFADAISVVVDKKYFGGDLALIRKIKDAVSIPVLAKDFVIDPYQIHELKAYGADAVLLIAKIVTPGKLVQLVELAGELNIEPIVEVQNEQELNNAIKTKTNIIAVNSRDLETFRVDINKACDLIRRIPKKFIRVAFSGVENKTDVKKYKEAGVKGVLVGTSLMKAKNVEGLIKDFKTL